MNKAPLLFKTRDRIIDSCKFLTLSEETEEVSKRTEGVSLLLHI